MQTHHNQNTGLYQTSSGHAWSTKEWLDLHYGAAKQEYEEMIRSVGILPGWRVLDAGCGSGNFIKPLSELVGINGHIEAIDLAPENVAVVLNWVRTQNIACSINANVGSLFSLPFLAETFDMVWCASVTQYLEDAELMAALQEFKRVLRPGGIVAIKEFDNTIFYFSPVDDPTLLWRSLEGTDIIKRRRDLLRPLQMMNWLADTGFTDVRQQTTLVERRQPLAKIERSYIAAFFQAQDLNWTSISMLSENDQRIWRSITTLGEPKYLLDQPNFYWREGHIVAIGHAPVASNRQ